MSPSISPSESWASSVLFLGQLIMLRSIQGLITFNSVWSHPIFSFYSQTPSYDRGSKDCRYCRSHIGRVWFSG
jgi:hypothetical protein